MWIDWSIQDAMQAQLRSYDDNYRRPIARIECQKGHCNLWVWEPGTQGTSACTIHIFDSSFTSVAPPTQGTWRSNDYVNALRLVNGFLILWTGRVFYSYMVDQHKCRSSQTCAPAAVPSHSHYHIPNITFPLLVGYLRSDNLYRPFHSKTLICWALWVRPMLSLMRFRFSTYCPCCGRFIFNEWWDEWTIRNKRGRRVHFRMRWRKRCQGKYFDSSRRLGCWSESALKWVHTPNFRAYEPSNCFIGHLLYSKILKSSYQAVRIFWIAGKHRLGILVLDRSKRAFVKQIISSLALSLWP